MLRIFKRRMLRVIYRPVNDNGAWRTRYTNELYEVYPVRWTARNVMKIERLRWLARRFSSSMQELDPWRKLIVRKPEALDV
jgi:hypothetical protein